MSTFKDNQCMGLHPRLRWGLIVCGGAAVATLVAAPALAGYTAGTNVDAITHTVTSPLVLTNGDEWSSTATGGNLFAFFKPDSTDPDNDPQVGPTDLAQYRSSFIGMEASGVLGSRVSGSATYTGTYFSYYDANSDGSYVVADGDLRIGSGTVTMAVTWSNGVASIDSGTLTQTLGPEHVCIGDAAYSLNGVPSPVSISSGVLTMTPDGTSGVVQAVLRQDALAYPETGACCLSDGTCVVVDVGPYACPIGDGRAGAIGAFATAACTAYGVVYNGVAGVYQGDEVNDPDEIEDPCLDATCDEPGACCLADGSCALMTNAGAAGIAECSAYGLFWVGTPGVYQGNGSTCLLADCPQPGVWCSADPLAACVPATLLGGGTPPVGVYGYAGDGSTCADCPVVATLSLEGPDDDGCGGGSAACQLVDAHPMAGFQVAVHVWMRGLTSSACAFQAFIDYDETEIAYVGAASSYTGVPFAGFTNPIAQANDGVLELDSFALGLGACSSADAHLATLIFTVDPLDYCTSTSLTFTTLGILPSTLKNSLGANIATALCNLPISNLGAPAPTVTCPLDIVTTAALPLCETATVPFAATFGGGCSAVVEYTIPIVGEIFSPHAFPVGTTTVTATVTDACGHEVTCTFDVTVNSNREVHLTVELPDSDPLESPTRCIHVVIDGDCVGSYDVPAPFSGAPASSTVEIVVDCADYESATVCVRDEQHTLSATTTLGPLNLLTGVYTAVATLELVAGDVNSDDIVDTGDAFLLFAQIGGGDEPDGGCPFDGTIGGDLSNNDDVFTEDFTILGANYGEFTLPALCGCPPPLAPPNSGPKASIPTASLDPVKVARVNLDGNDVFDWRDVLLLEMKHRLPHTLSAKMRALGTMQSGK